LTATRPLVATSLLLALIALALVAGPAASADESWVITSFEATIAIQRDGSLQVAETSRQQFNEQRNIFAAYLPYAIVFHCVDKWANAFRDIDTEEVVRYWYVGSRPFATGDFSRTMQGFATDLSSTIVSTPGGSGGSGFSGSSGGGGGGGGGSW